MSATSTSTITLIINKRQTVILDSKSQPGSIAEICDEKKFYDHSFLTTDSSVTVESIGYTRMNFKHDTLLQPHGLSLSRNSVMRFSYCVRQGLYSVDWAVKPKFNHNSKH